MTSQELRKLKVGSKVSTTWDHAPMVMRGKIEQIIRQPHKRTEYVVRLSDGTVERIGSDQIK